MDTFQNGIKVSAASAEAQSLPCPACGAIMSRKGSCFKCDNCGKTVSARIGKALLAKPAADDEEAPCCPNCGAAMLQAGSMFRCLSCGSYV